MLLEFRNVDDDSPLNPAARLSNVSLALESGELALIRMPTPEPSPLADLASGLRLPDRGEVFFDGVSWTAMRDSEQARQRSRIGRVFEQGGWINNLTAAENIMLPARHHTRRRDDDIRAEASRLARLAGLAAVPDERPESMRRDELRRLQWVRAFMNRPALVLLEKPMTDLPAGAVDNLLTLVHEALAGGAAVLWTAMDTTFWKMLEETPRTQRFVMRDGYLLTCEETYG